MLLARNGKPAISVIVPVYNVERYVRQCLDALLAQTYPLEEIVLVDDGSTDSSGAICDEYAAAHDKITAVHKRNSGLGYARNTGMDSFTRPSDYVMFVDSDDWLERDAVEYLVGALGDDPADCVIGGHTKKTAEGKTVFELKLENRRFEGAEVREELLPRLCGSMPTSHDSVPMSACSALYRRSMLEEHNLRFPPRTGDDLGGLRLQVLLPPACAHGRPQRLYRLLLSHRAGLPHHELSPRPLRGVRQVLQEGSGDGPRGKPFR